MTADSSVSARAGSTGPRAIGILGGTFDPVHVGHLALAREARRALDLDRVLLVPNADPPHKGDTVAEAEERAEMVRLAVEHDAGLELSRIELERAGPSYAVDTVAEVARRSRQEGRPEPWLLLSDEAFAGLPAWREPRRILELARVAVLPRPGAARPDPASVAAVFPGLESRVALVDGPSIEVSATAVRERLGRGESVEGLVPDVVGKYIAEHGLYRREGPSTTALASTGTGTP